MTSSGHDESACVCGFCEGVSASILPIGSGVHAESSISAKKKKVAKSGDSATNLVGILESNT